MRVVRMAIPAAVAVTALAAAPGTQAAKPADTVLRNGFVYTVDKRDRTADAVAVRNGKIVYVGNDRGARKFIGKRTKVTNLRGKMVMPGLQDAHVHTMLGGKLALSCDLKFARLTMAQFTGQIADCLKATADKEPDHWLEVESWFRQAMQPAGTDPTKADLDALSTKRPIVVTSSDHHTVLLNSRALELAGITAATPDPPNGHIARDAQGNPTGILEDGPAFRVKALIPPLTAAENREAAKAALDALRRQGVTSFMSQVSTEEEMTAFESLRRAGKLTARAHFGPNVEREEHATPSKFVDRVLALKRRFDTGRTVARPGMTVRNAAELALDGVLNAPAHTGRMLEPYFVNSGTPAQPSWVPGTYRGPDFYIKPDLLNPLIAALAKAGIEPQMHAIGDRSVREALDAVQYARQQTRVKDFRPQISHAEAVDAADDKRFKQLDVTPIMSWQWAKPAPDTIDGARDYMGPERFARLEPVGTLHEAGARVAFGSDWPVDELNEWFAIQVAVTRQNRAESGKYAGYRLGDGPLLPRRAALRGITLNSAYALHHDDRTGSLERGKLADLIVLDQNVLRVPAMQIADTNVLMTMVGGKVVYKRR